MTLKSRPQYSGQIADLARVKSFVRPEIEIQQREVVSSGNQRDPLVDISDNTAILRKYQREHLSKSDDIGFDVVLEAPGSMIPATTVIGVPVIIGSIDVPAGQKMLLQQYLFFMRVDNLPVTDYDLLAEPTEVITWLTFDLALNGMPVQRSELKTYNAAGDPISISGYSILSKSITDDGDWANAGHTIQVRGPSRLDVTMTRFTDFAGSRTYNSAGARLRGFFVQETGEKNK
jgi:hypothetical protein